MLSLLPVTDCSRVKRVHTRLHKHSCRRPYQRTPSSDKHSEGYCTSPPCPEESRPGSSSFLQLPSTFSSENMTKSSCHTANIDVVPVSYVLAQLKAQAVHACVISESSQLSSTSAQSAWHSTISDTFFPYKQNISAITITVQAAVPVNSPTGSRSSPARTCRTCPHR
jgi:hypothetical protein